LKIFKLSLILKIPFPIKALHFEQIIMGKKNSNLTIFRYTLLLRKDLLVLLFISIIMIIVIDFYLIGEPELFSGAKKIGQIVSILCFAYISIFIYYLLSINLKNLKDKENLQNYIAKNTSRITEQVKGMIRECAKAASNIKKYLPRK
jgi:hypothetical protein